jgi:hypothetical protein
MLAGNMCCGVLREELMIRLAAETTIASLKSPQVRECDFTKRPMRGMFLVNAQGCANQRKVDRWVRLALEHVLSLPPK